MSRTGRITLSAVLLAVAVALFVPVFADAAAGFAPGGWTYGPYVQTALDYLPLILAVAALLVFVKPVTKGRFP